MTIYRGRCHCGSIELAFETTIAPYEIEVRACQCSFCRRNVSRAIADPAGLLTISVCDDQRLHRYVSGQLNTCCAGSAASTRRPPPPARESHVLSSSSTPSTTTGYSPAIHFPHPR
jgi:hypothetical protein